jgi:hypothetical protein
MQKVRLFALLSTASLLGWAGMAAGAILTTPAVPLIPTGGCQCVIVNVDGTNSYTIASIEQRSVSSGGIVDSTTNVLLAPLTGDSSVGVGGAGSPFYCRFDTGSASPKKVRASIFCTDGGGTNPVALPATVK